MKQFYHSASNEELEADPLERHHQQIFTTQGGLVHHSIPIHTIHKVLDLGSGGGHWAISMAKRHPHIHVMGIDNRLTATRTAYTHARWQQATQLNFQQMEIDQSLALADNWFDLVHIQNMSTLRPLNWETLLAEMIRVTRPGGWLNIVSIMNGQTSSTAFNRLLELLKETRASETSMSAVHIYGRLLAEGLERVAYNIYPLDLRTGMLEDILNILDRCRNIVCQDDRISPDLYNTLLAEARHEMRQEHACGYFYQISAIGQKGH